MQSITWAIHKQLDCFALVHYINWCHCSHIEQWKSNVSRFTLHQGNICCCRNDFRR